MALSSRDLKHLSSVIIRLEAIDSSIHAAPTETVKQARRFNAAAEIDDLGETLHRIATSWRNQAPI